MRQTLINLNLDILNKSQALNACAEALREPRPKSLFFINAHCFNIAQQDHHYHKVLDRSDLVFNDGIGIKLIGLLNNVRFHDNLNGTDLIPQIIDLGVLQNLSFYFVGGSDVVVHCTQAKLREKYPDIRINGIQNGFFTESQEAAIIQDINKKKPDILIVCMGVPKQELWIEKIRNNLHTVRLCIAGGGVFDFISGKIRRAPVAMRRANMEWLYRLCLEPRRLWKRYLVGMFLLGYHVIRSRLIRSRF